MYGKLTFQQNIYYNICQNVEKTVNKMTLQRSINSEASTILNHNVPIIVALTSPQNTMTLRVTKRLQCYYALACKQVDEIYLMLY